MENSIHPQDDPADPMHVRGAQSVSGSVNPQPPLTLVQTLYHFTSFSADIRLGAILGIYSCMGSRVTFITNSDEPRGLFSQCQSVIQA